MGVVDHQVRVVPGDAAIFGVVVGPGEQLHNPGGTHLAHHFQAALDFPLFHLVGQAGVDANDGVGCVYGLGWAGHDEQRRGLDKPDKGDEQQQTNPAAKVKLLGEGQRHVWACRAVW